MADPTASVIDILYDGLPIINDGTSGVIYASARFESQNAAQPGTFEFTVRDPARTLSFVTGKEISLRVDGYELYAGYVTQVTRKYALPVDDTSRPVRSRQWVLRGVDYNILFDKRVLRNPGNYLERIPNTTGDPTDGEIVRQMASDYIDVPAGFDTSSFVDDIDSANADDTFIWMQQGTLWRDAMTNAALLTGAIWYFDAAKNLIWRALEDSQAKWGFSDVPNNRAVTASPSTFQGATIGFRDADIVEDGSAIVNDAFVWGGSEFSGTSGGTVFDRFQATESIQAHGRWQFPENDIGKLSSQRQVDARSHVIVNGSPDGLQPGSVAGDPNRGLRFSQWQVKFTWYAHDVPKIAGFPDHIRPGDLTTMIFYVLGESNRNPLIQTLPCRQIRISFPTLNPAGDSYVQFEGYFSLQPDDPFTLWSYLRKQKDDIRQTVRQLPVSSSSGSSGTTTYGSFGQFAPIPDPDGSTTLFTLPSGYGYLAGTTQVYLNGILMLSGTHYAETDPAGGTITLFSAPLATDKLWMTARTTSGTAVAQEGVVGFGATTTGGQGGTVYTVSTYAQFKAALLASGPRIVNVTGSTLFDAGGDTINVRSGNLTLDGSAYTRSVKGLDLILSSSNIIVTDMRFRPSDDASLPDSAAGIMLNPGLGNTMSRILIRNCHLAWAEDVCLNIFNHVTDVTIQNNIIGPALYETPFKVGVNGYGFSMHGDAPDRHYNITVYRNLMIHNPQRNLRSYAAQYAEFVNNVVYNWDDKLANANPIGASWVANMGKKGPGTQGSNEWMEMQIFGDDPDYFSNSVYCPRTGADANLMWDSSGSPITLNSGDFIFHGTGNPLAAPYGGALHNVTPVPATLTVMNEVVTAAGTTSPDSLELELKDQYANGTWLGDWYRTVPGAPVQPSWP